MDKNQRFIKKGFTLTELIIVIVIIGILTSVLIPGVSKYIEKARLSNDKVDAKNMTMLLSLEAYDLDKDYFEPSYVIAFLEMNGYDLVSRAKNYRFCYNYMTNSIEVVSDTQLVLDATADHPILDNPINRIRNLNGSYLYIDKGNDQLSVSIDTLSNLLDYALASSSDPNLVLDQIYQEAIKVFKNNVPTPILNLDPKKTIYVHESGYFTTGNNITNIIITKGTTSLPIFNQQSINLDSVTNIYLPSSIIEVNDNSVLSNLNLTTTEIKVATTSVKQILPTTLQDHVEVIAPNTNSKQVANILIEYVGSVKDSLGQNIVWKNLNLDQPINSVLNLPRGGTFSVVFNQFKIDTGSTIDIKNYPDPLGNFIYDVRVFDINGLLYGRGIFKYSYLEKLGYITINYFNSSFVTIDGTNEVEISSNQLPEIPVINPFNLKSNSAGVINAQILAPTTDPIWLSSGGYVENILSDKTIKTYGAPYGLGYQFRLIGLYDNPQLLGTNYLNDYQNYLTSWANQQKNVTLYAKWQVTIPN